MYYGQLELCDKIDPAMLTSSRSVSIMTKPNQVDFGYNLMYEGTSYLVVLNKENQIMHISVNDSTFTYFNLKFGSKYSDIDRSKISDEGMIPGFGYYVVLDNNWKIMFVSTDIIETRSISNNSLVTGFMKDCSDCKCEK